MTSPDTARSPLNLRLLLAVFGLAACVATGLLALRADAVLPAVLLFVLAAVAVVDLVVVARRRSAQQRAHRDAGHQHDSLFE